MRRFGQARLLGSERFVVFSGRSWSSCCARCEHWRAPASKAAWTGRRRQNAHGVGFARGKTSGEPAASLRVCQLCLFLLGGSTPTGVVFQPLFETRQKRAFYPCKTTPEESLPRKANRSENIVQLTHMYPLLQDAHCPHGLSEDTPVEILGRGFHYTSDI